MASGESDNAKLSRAAIRVDFHAGVHTSESIWYFLSLLGTVTLIVGLAWPGAALVDVCLPWRLRPVARIFLAPLLGLALLVLIATLFGWVGRGYRPWICLPLTLALVVAGVLRRGGQTAHFLRRHASPLAAFTTLASVPFLGQLLRYGAFNPFNDAFIYLVHAQWLQGHGFAEPAEASGAHPVWAQVIGFQRTGFRMGGSFLLGWLQAAAGRSWSWEVYPALLTIALVTGGLAVGAIVLSACPGQRRVAWLAALIAVVSFDGFASGAQFGFLPQTLGAAFTTGALALRGLEMTSRLPAAMDQTFRARLSAALPQALLAAAGILCYSELAPFLGAAWALSHCLAPPLGSLGGAANLRARLARAWPALALVVLLVNFEWLRAWRAWQIQLHAVTANPVPWRPWEFAGHALGLRAASFDVADWFWNVHPFYFLLALPAVAAFAWQTRLALAERQSAARFRPDVLLPIGALVAICTLAFLWFRYAVPSPWPDQPGTGQSWSQFKLSQWASLGLLALVSAVVVTVLNKWRWRRGLVAAVFVAWCAAGLGWSVQKMPRRTERFRRAVGVARDPFRAYLALRDSLSSVPGGDGIYLDLPARDFVSLKGRQLLTYFLHDRPLAGDWTIDPGLLPEFLPDEERNLPAAHCAWIVRTLPSGGFVVEPTVTPAGRGTEAPASLEAVTTP